MEKKLRSELAQQCSRFKELDIQRRIPKWIFTYSNYIFAPFAKFTWLLDIYLIFMAIFPLVCYGSAWTWQHVSEINTCLISNFFSGTCQPGLIISKGGFSNSFPYNISGKWNF